MAHANPLKSPDPFADLGGGAQAPSSGVLGGALNTLFGPSPKARTRAAQQEQNSALQAFRQSFLGKYRQGLPADKALQQAIQENQEALSDPDFPKKAQEFIDLLKPGSSDRPVVVPSGSRLASPTGEVLLKAEPEPPANVKVIDEIEKAELKGDPKRVKRLQRLLPRDASNKITVMDALRLRIIGVEVDPELSFDDVNTITPKEALAALNSGNDDRSATDNDLIQAAVAGDVPARQAIKVKTALKRQEMDAFMALIASQNVEFAKFITEKTPSVDEVFEEIDRQKGEAKPQAKAPGGDAAKGATTLPGLSAPAVGGTAGQATGPTIDVEGLTDAIKGLSAEDKKLLAEALKAEGL